MAKKEPPFIHTTLVKVITNYRDFDGDFNGINFILKLLEFYKNVKSQNSKTCSLLFKQF